MAWRTALIRVDSADGDTIRPLQIEERISSVHRPDKLIARRIEAELAEAEQKYHIFVAK